ncbi:MAG: cache domain-containing protein, partial [Cyanobacteria bacterium P01_C01_bin.69]
MTVSTQPSDNTRSAMDNQAGEQRGKTKSLKLRATMVAIALSTLPVFAVGSIAYTLASKAIVRQTTSDQRLYSELAGSQIDDFLVSRLRDLEVLALNPILTQSELNATPEQQAAEIERFFETLEYFDSLVLFDPDGNAIAQSNIGNPFRGNYSDRAYFQEALSTGKPTMNGPGLSKSTGKLRVEFAIPIKDQQTNETRFVIRARIPGKYINELFTLLEAKGSGWYLVNEIGTIFAGSDQEHLSRLVSTRVPSAVDFVEKHHANSGIFTEHSASTNTEQQELLSYVPINLSEEIPQRKIGLITYTNTQISLASQRQLAITFTIGTLLTGLGAAITALLLVRRITTPIQKLTETARTIVQKGRFDLRAPVMSQDEIGSLATSLNQLIEWVSLRTQALETSQADLEQRTQELGAIINSLGDGLLVINPANRIERFNPPLLKMLGRTAEAITGQLATDIFPADLTQLIQQSQQDASRAFSAEVDLADERVGKALVNTIFDTDTLESLGCVVLIRDITIEKEVDRM